MRSKAVVPMGQGCKAMKKARKISGLPDDSRCYCHPDLYIARCMGCGELFHSKAPQTKTCSDRCRKRLSRMRHEKMFQAVLSYAGSAI